MDLNLNLARVSDDTHRQPSKHLDDDSQRSTCILLLKKADRFLSYSDRA